MQQVQYYQSLSLMIKYNPFSRIYLIVLLGKNQAMVQGVDAAVSSLKKEIFLECKKSRDFSLNGEKDALNAQFIKKYLQLLKAFKEFQGGSNWLLLRLDQTGELQ